MSRPCLNYKFCFGPLRCFFSWRGLLEFIFYLSAKVMHFYHMEVLLIFLGDVSMTTFFFYLNLKIRHVMAIDDQELIIILAVSCHRKSLRNCIFSLKRPAILLSICSMEPFTLILNIDYVF